MDSLVELPRPVYFVCRNRARWNDLLDGSSEVSLDKLHTRFRDARESWSVQPYIQLKQRGLNVFLVDRFIPGEICIATYEELRVSQFPITSFVVCCRHDRGIPRICQQRIVQNPLNVMSDSDFYLPHWPQPFINARDPSRGTRLENIAYKGREANLALPFRSQEFIESLAGMGVKLVVSPKGEASRVDDSREYSQMDMVLAVRDSTEYNLSIKPPSKLLNAWIAGCPAIMGPESAYQALRQHPLDFFEIRSTQEAIEYVRILKENPSLFAQAQEQCRVRAEAFSADAIALQWRDLLAGPVFEAHERWAKAGAIQKLSRPFHFALQSFRHRQEKKAFFKGIHSGRRLF